MSQVGLLEQDVLEMSCFVRSAKNSFAPINKILPEVFSLIAYHWYRDEDLTTLTHVCYRWREILISCPSLWTCLDCKNIDKTRVYLKRSKASALKIRLGEYLDEAFRLTIPHLGQLGSLSLLGSPDHLLNLTTHFESHAPLLKTLSLTVASTRYLILQD